MNITKIGHCCLVIEVDGVKLMTDPGAWTSAQNEITGLSAIFVTHEHADHFHLESLMIVLANNPDAKVYANTAVGKILQEAGIPFELLEHGAEIKVGDVPVSGFGHDHAPIYSGIPAVQNTGFLFQNRLYYPGDGFFEPKVPVEILALPVAGPWMTIAEAMDFARQVKPSMAFPMHDGFLAFPGPFHGVPERLLPTYGIEFKSLLAGGRLSL